MKVKECMCNNVTFVKPDCSIKDCAKIMSNNHIGCVPVCDNTNKVVGLVTDRDIILRCVACDKETNNTPISDIMTTNVCCCNPETDVKEAEKIMSDNQIRRIPVVDNNKVVGMLTLGNLASNKYVDENGVYATLENICKCDDKNAE